MLRMLSSFLSEDIFKKGLQVRCCWFWGAASPVQGGHPMVETFSGALGVSHTPGFPLLTCLSWCSPTVLPPHLLLQQHRLH